MITGAASNVMIAENARPTVWAGFVQQAGVHRIGEDIHRFDIAHCDQWRWWGGDRCSVRKTGAQHSRSCRREKRISHIILPIVFLSPLIEQELCRLPFSAAKGSD
jgi:hypothetical protein